MLQQFLYTPIFITLSVTLFGTFLLFWPNSSQAFSLPEKISLSAGDTVRVIEPNQFQSWFRVGQKVVFDPEKFREGELIETSCSSYPFFCTAFIPRLHIKHIVTAQTFVFEQDQAIAALTEIFDELDRDPINAKLTMNDDGTLTVAAEALPGLRIDRTASIVSITTVLRTASSQELILPLKTEIISAKVSSETIHKLGITTKIAEGKTNFRGSPKNRIFNIHRAIEQYDGLVIAPGEEFSFVEYLGEVDGEHGYLPELVIKNNKTEPEFGGGICQVSTTVFRAALFAGLEITERRNHAYPVQYYKPYGMDATIYIPKPDLKFKNNTPGSILILPKIVGTELTITFFGTSDGRTTTIDGPHILESNPDGSMRTIFTQTVKDKDGATFINATFPSNYKSPSLFPHPGEEILTEKPKNWSGKQWKAYKAIHP